MKDKIILAIISILLIFLGLCSGMLIEKQLNNSSYHDMAMNKLSEYHTSIYNNSSYNCVDMSVQWKELFEGIGLNTSIMHGSDSDSNIGHAWVAVCFPDGSVYEFESTIARFSKVSDDWETIINGQTGDN